MSSSLTGTEFMMDVYAPRLLHTKLFHLVAIITLPDDTRRQLKGQERTIFNPSKTPLVLLPAALLGRSRSCPLLHLLFLVKNLVRTLEVQTHMSTISKCILSLKSKA